MCPARLLGFWQESNNNTRNTPSSSLLESDFAHYQNQVLELLSTTTTTNNDNKKHCGKRAKIKNKLCSLFSNERFSSRSNNTESSLDYLLEVLGKNPRMSKYLDQFCTFLDGDIFDFDRNNVELEGLECKTDIWSEKYDSCLEVNATSKYLLCMKCRLYDIGQRNVTFEFSSITFKIDYCKQPTDIIDFQVEMKGKIWGDEDEYGTSAKAVWNEKKFVIFINQSQKVFHMSSENPLLDFNEIMSEHYGRFTTNSSLDLSKVEKYFCKREKQEKREYTLKFNNYLQLEDDCLYHGTAQMDFRPVGFNIELKNSTVQLQHIQFNYFTVQKKKDPFVSVEIDNISYIDACNVIYSGECEDKAVFPSLAEYICGYNCLANNLRGYLIYTKGSHATLNYKGCGTFFGGCCPPGLFTFKASKEGHYKSWFKPAKEGEERKLPNIHGFGDFKFHRNQLCDSDSILSFGELLVGYFITGGNRRPILNFDFLGINGVHGYMVIPTEIQTQNGILIGKIKLLVTGESEVMCDFKIHGILNIATIDFMQHGGKIWMRPKKGGFDFLNRLYLMSMNNTKSLSDIGIVTH